MSRNPPAAPATRSPTAHPAPSPVQVTATCSPVRRRWRRRRRPGWCGLRAWPPGRGGGGAALDVLRATCGSTRRWSATARRTARTYGAPCQPPPATSLPTTGTADASAPPTPLASLRPKRRSASRLAWPGRRRRRPRRPAPVSAATARSACAFASCGAGSGTGASVHAGTRHRATATNPSHATHPSRRAPRCWSPDFRWSHFLSDGTPRESVRTQRTVRASFCSRLHPSGTARPVKATLGRSHPSATYPQHHWNGERTPAYRLSHDRYARLPGAVLSTKYQLRRSPTSLCPAGTAGPPRVVPAAGAAAPHPRCWFCLQGACVEAESDPDVPNGYLAFAAQVPRTARIPTSPHPHIPLWHVITATPPRVSRSGRRFLSVAARALRCRRRRRPRRPNAAVRRPRGASRRHRAGDDCRDRTSLVPRSSSLTLMPSDLPHAISCLPSDLTPSRPPGDTPRRPRRCPTSHLATSPPRSTAALEPTSYLPFTHASPHPISSAGQPACRRSCRCRRACARRGLYGADGACAGEDGTADGGKISLAPLRTGHERRRGRLPFPYTAISNAYAADGRTPLERMLHADM